MTAAGTHAATAGCVVVQPPWQGVLCPYCWLVLINLHAASAWPSWELSTASVLAAIASGHGRSGWLGRTGICVLHLNGDGGDMIRGVLHALRLVCSKAVALCVGLRMLGGESVIVVVGNFLTAFESVIEENN